METCTISQSSNSDKICRFFPNTYGKSLDQTRLKMLLKCYSFCDNKPLKSHHYGNHSRHVFLKLLQTAIINDCKKQNANFSWNQVTTQNNVTDTDENLNASRMCSIYWASIFAYCMLTQECYMEHTCHLFQQANTCKYNRQMDVIALTESSFWRRHKNCDKFGNFNLDCASKQSIICIFKENPFKKMYQ